MGTAFSNFIEDVSGKSRAWAEHEKQLRLSTLYSVMAEHERQLRLGTFYSVINDVVTGVVEPFSEIDLQKIRRKQPHKFYAKIVEHAKEASTDNLVPAYESDRSEIDPSEDPSSLQSFVGETMSMKTRKRRLKDYAIDGGERTTAKIAHLIPHAASCSDAYCALAEAATGVAFPVQGSATTEIRKRRRVLVHGRYKSETEKTRINETGLKHCRTNMACLVGQKENMDLNPNILILPLKSLQDTLDYQGGPFSVLVLCEKANIYQDCQLTDEYDQCSVDELDLALTTLAQFVKGAAQTLVDLPEDVLAKIRPTQEKTTIRDVYDKLRKSLKVHVPALNQSMKDLKQSTTADRKIKVVKLRFSNADTSTHQESDPFLLFVKAAAVWSNKMDEKLLPVCDLPQCEVCAQKGQRECTCDGFDPCEIPREIVVENETANGILCVDP